LAPIRRTEVTGFLVVLLVLLTFLAGASALASLLLPELRRGWESRGWPSTQGRLVYKELEGDRGLRRNLVVRYEYAIEGVDYEGSRVSFAGVGRRRAPRELAAGRPVSVYFDPARPYESVLYPGFVSLRSLMVLLLVAFPSAATCGWLALGIRRVLRA
jgi:hypothetical protein